MVCMATNGAKQIKGGNWRIFASMLNASSATVHLSTPVSTISKQPDNTYHLTTSSNHTSTFDEIILAAPLQYTNLTITPPPEHIPDIIPYTKLHTTLFASPYLLDPLAFNLAPGTPVPQYVLTTLPPTEIPADSDSAGSPGFFSISIHAAPVTSAYLSHFLGRPISDAEAEKGDVNGSVSWIHHKLWYSYPRELPRVTFEEIRLDEGLWYTSGIESFISTMETSALSGRNVARLVRDGWMGKEGVDEEKEKEVKKEWVEEL
jgi:prenylcysteine oxidase/farnesylcysteine lyase